MLEVLRRIIHVVMLAAFLGPATGFVSIGNSELCNGDCPGEEASEHASCDDDCSGEHDMGGGCSGSCHLCTCCPGLRLVVSTFSIAALPASLVGRVAWRLSETPATPEPHDILHVPKPALA